jgi:hypothetical protein
MIDMTTIDKMLAEARIAEPVYTVATPDERFFFCSNDNSDVGEYQVCFTTTDIVEISEEDNIGDYTMKILDRDMLSREYSLTYTSLFHQLARIHHRFIREYAGEPPNMMMVSQDCFVWRKNHQTIFGSIEARIRPRPPAIYIMLPLDSLVQAAKESHMVLEEPLVFRLVRASSTIFNILLASYKEIQQNKDAVFVREAIRKAYKRGQADIKAVTNQVLIDSTRAQLLVFLERLAADMSECLRRRQELFNLVSEFSTRPVFTSLNSLVSTIGDGKV